MSFALVNFETAVGGFRVGPISLSVLPGEVVVLRGASGSGKSTLLLGVAGIYPSCGGQLLRGSESLQGLPPEHRRIAFVFQEPALFPKMTVVQNVGFSPRAQGKSKLESEALALSWLDRLRVGELKDRYPHQLSGGQAQRVAIARALASGFQTLLLDEPFSALESALRYELAGELKALIRAEGLYALWVTHFDDEAKWVGDRQETLAHGKLSLPR